MRDQDGPSACAVAEGHRRETPASADHYTSQLLRVVQVQRQKREAAEKAESVQLAAVTRHAARHTARTAPREEVFVQGVLASEIGLVAPAASRRGPIIRPKAQDLELSGYTHSAFGGVSKKLHDDAESAQAAQAAREQAYRNAIREQASYDRLKKESAKERGAADCKHAQELRHIERERLAKIRDAKLRELEAFGVNPERMALIAKSITT